MVDTGIGHPLLRVTIAALLITGSRLLLGQDLAVSSGKEDSIVGLISCQCHPVPPKHGRCHADMCSRPLDVERIGQSCAFPWPHPCEAGTQNGS